MAGNVYTKAHKNTMQAISCSCSLNCPPYCRWISSCSEEMELCAQMGAHSAPPQAEMTVKWYVSVCLCAQPSLCTCICHSPYLGMEGHPCIRLICVHVCVCLCGRAQLDSHCWHWLGDSLNTRLCWRVGVPPRLPLCGEWILIIQSDLNLSCLWGCYPLPRDELILLLHKRPPTGKKAEKENCDALLKGTPEVSAISSTGVKEI